MRIFLCPSSLVCAAVLLLPASRPATDLPLLPPTSFEPSIRAFIADESSVRRFYDLPWSEDRWDRLDQLYRAWNERLDTHDFEALEPQGRIDYLLLRNHLQNQPAQFALARQQFGEIEELVPFRRAIQDLELARWRIAPLQAREAAGDLARLAGQINALRDRIKKPAREGAEEGQLVVNPVAARRAAQAVRQLRQSLKTWHEFHDGFLPDFSWWVNAPYEKAGQAMERYAKFLMEEIAGLKGEDEDPLVGDPIGREALEQALAAEWIAASPEEVLGIGQREFDWCAERMLEASREMGLGGDWKAALNQVKAAHVDPGGQHALVAAQARHAIQFLKERNLLTLPALAEETWRVSMLSPERQKTLPYAAYGPQSMLVAYASQAMSHDDKLMSMRGNNRHFTRIVTPHELIPGHHLQGFMADRFRPHRKAFSTPFLVEGWALYWEIRLWELGYPLSPEDRIGMLFWRMHRCARIIVSLKFHLGQMAPPEMVDFLVDRVGHERLGATSEVRRYIGSAYSPLYQCAYMIGGLQLRALHREAVESGRMTEREFHDAVLAHGPIPIELIRAGVLGQPLSRDSQPQPGLEY